MSSVAAGKFILIAASVVILGAVIVGTVVVGSPAAARRERLDQVRVADLQAIDRLAVSFAHAHGTVPIDLVALEHEPGYSVPGRDPESGTAYGYQRVSADAFRLCASFDTDTAANRMAGSYLQSFDATWAHGRGMQCFERRVQI